MLTALILICSVGVAPDLAHCTRSNARVVMSVPTEDTLAVGVALIIAMICSNQRA